METQTALVQVETITAIQVFGCDQAETLMSRIEAEVRSFVPDLETPGGRKAIASLAHKVSKSKVIIDQHRKALTSDWKAKAKAVDIEGKMFRERHDALRDEVRQPLTDWQAAEDSRIAAKALAEQLDIDHTNALVEHDLFLRQKEIERKEAEQRQAEEQRAAQAEAERQEAERKAREARIAAEAAERATREANEQAARKEAEAADAVKAAQEAEQRAKWEHEESLKQAEAQRIQAVKDAEAKAEREAKAKEEARLAEEARIAEEQAKREANKSHRRKINNAVLVDLVKAGLDEATGKDLIKLIATGQIAHTQIQY